MANIFQELALLNAGIERNNYELDRAELNEIVSFYKARPEYEECIEWFSSIRDLSVGILRELDSFMCDEDMPITELPENLQADRLGFCRNMYLVFAGRYVFPVKDIKGNVMGFVGYNGTYEEDNNAKYLDSRNVGYVAKRSTLFGMENLEKYYKDGYVFLPEGPICAIYLRSQGLNALATLGSSISPYVVEIAKRFGNNAIFIHDNDEKGYKFNKEIFFSAPKARRIHMAHCKDVDDERKSHPEVVDELKNFIRNPFKRYTTFRKIGR